VRLSGVSGFISVVFLGVVFVIALYFAFHYWQQQNLPRIGQLKKRRLRKFMRRWIYVAIIAAIIGLIGAANYYLAPIAILTQPSEKQYLSIAESNLEALTVGTSPSLTLILENGPGDIIVTFSDVSIRLTPFVPEKYLTYTPKERQQSRFTPHKKMAIKWIFNELVLTQEQFDALNAKTPSAGLYLFAKGEWTDESGNKHPFPFCYQYSNLFPTRIVYCSDDIKIQ
jgi:hypothetical protein